MHRLSGISPILVLSCISCLARRHRRCAHAPPFVLCPLPPRGHLECLHIPSNSHYVSFTFKYRQIHDDPGVGSCRFSEVGFPTCGTLVFLSRVPGPQTSVSFGGRPLLRFSSSVNVHGTPIILHQYFKSPSLRLSFAMPPLLRQHSSMSQIWEQLEREIPNDIVASIPVEVFNVHDPSASRSPVLVRPLSQQFPSLGAPAGPDLSHAVDDTFAIIEEDEIFDGLPPSTRTCPVSHRFHFLPPDPCIH